MKSIAQVASAFASFDDAKCGNAETDGIQYKLYDTVIALKVPGGVMLNWGRWYTPTTANHMNHVLAAMGIGKRVGYAEARKHGLGEVFVEGGDPLFLVSPLKAAA